MRGLQPLISKFLQTGLLAPCNSPCKTPILAVKKLEGSYRLAQALRAINQAVVPIHLIAPNPYNLPSQIPIQTQWYSVLDLKDAFFCIPAHSNSQFLFAFEWRDPNTKYAQQLTCTVLPQGFRDSPHLLGQALPKDLSSLTLENRGCLLQYLDDLLICSPERLTSDSNTILVLKHLAEQGYQGSPAKAQITSQQVTFLGLVLTLGRGILLLTTEH